MERKLCSLAVKRVQSDLSGFATLEGVSIKFPDPSNILEFVVRVHPQEGIWKRGNFDFTFSVSDDFPFVPPTVKCVTKIWHPNIDEDGNVCLSILKKNYTAATSLASLIIGLQFLLVAPNPNDPLNMTAADQMLQDITKFEKLANDYIDIYCPKEEKFHKFDDEEEEDGEEKKDKEDKENEEKNKEKEDKPKEVKKEEKKDIEKEEKEENEDKK